jgi:endonuclease YncB( thermonuclease family)
VAPRHATAVFCHLGGRALFGRGRIGHACGVPQLVVVALLAVAASVGVAPAEAAGVYRVGRVVDGDTVYLTDGTRIRLVQIDTPEVSFRRECFGEAASAATRRLLPPGTAVRLVPEPATDRVDAYGRLLRYVIRARDGLNVNVSLVAAGDAAPYFYGGRRGRYAAALERFATRARARRLGVWGACPGTVADYTRGIDTGKPRPSAR